MHERVRKTRRSLAFFASFHILRGPLWSLTLSHALIGLYLSARLGLYPALSTAFHLNYQQIGLIGTVTTLVASLAQPAFGWLGDRHGLQRLLLPWGVAWLGLGTGLLGLAPGYSVLVGLAGASVLGVAAFWPLGAAAVTASTPPQQRGTAFAIFQTGGNLGAVAGPLVANALLSAAGLSGTVWLIPASILMALLLLITLQPVNLPARALPDGLKADRLALGGLLLTLAVMAAAALILTGLNTYLALLETGRHVSQATASQELSLLFAASAVGPFLAGPLSDRAGRPPIMAACLAGSVLASLSFLFAPLPWRGPTLAITGILVAGAATLAVLFAQELQPGSPATAAGVVQGLGYTLAALGTWVLGALADRWGPIQALSTLAIVAALGALAALALTRARRFN